MRDRHSECQVLCVEILAVSAVFGVRSLHLWGVGGGAIIRGVVTCSSWIFWCDGGVWVVGETRLCGSWN